MIYSKVYLSIPVTLEDLANFTVVYENGENFTTDYIIVNTSSNDTNLKFYKSKEDNEKFLTFFLKNT
jgi:thioredoxin reductase